MAIPRKHESWEWLTPEWKFMTFHVGLGRIPSIILRRNDLLRGRLADDQQAIRS